MDEEEVGRLIGRALREQGRALAVAFSAIVPDDDRETVLARLRFARRLFYDRGEPFAQQLLDDLISVLEADARPAKR